MSALVILDDRSRAGYSDFPLQFPLPRPHPQVTYSSLTTCVAAKPQVSRSLPQEAPRVLASSMWKRQTLDPGLRSEAPTRGLATPRRSRRLIQMARKPWWVFALLTFTRVTLSWGGREGRRQSGCQRGGCGGREGGEGSQGQASMGRQTGRQNAVSSPFNKECAALGQRPWAAEGPSWTPGSEICLGSPGAGGGAV